MEGRITPKMNLYQLMADYPALILLFIKKRLVCVGCEMSKFETLGDLAKNYNLDLKVLMVEIASTIAKKQMIT